MEVLRAGIRNALNELLLKKAEKTWDDVIEPRARLSDIDKDAIEAFKAAKSTLQKIFRRRKHSGLVEIH